MIGSTARSSRTAPPSTRTCCTPWPRSAPAPTHCAAGKDRAGLSIAVTLLALDVERDAIVADYLESNATHRRYKVRRNGSSSRPLPRRPLELLSPLFDARAEYLTAAFETIEETWVSIDAYCSGRQVTPEHRQRLRERLLDSTLAARSLGS